MDELILELTPNPKGPRIYHKVRRYPVKIGRGYDNDIILSDPYVSASHLLVQQEEDRWIVEDQESENGLFLGRKGPSLSKVELKGGEEIRIGKTTIRFVTTTLAVKETLSLRGKKGEHFLSRPLAAWGLFISLLGVTMIEEYLASVREISLLKLMAGAIPIGLLAVIWAGLWAFVGGLIKKRGKFYFQLSVAVLYFLSLAFILKGGDLLSYNFNEMALTEWYLYGTNGLLLGGLLYFNLNNVTFRTSRGRYLMANIIALGGVFSVWLLTHGAKPDFNPNPSFPAKLRPPYYKVVRGQSLEKVFAENEKLFERIKPL